jgi:protein O-mannosyl-transferase
MPNKINISPRKQKLIVYVVLILATLAVYWQVHQYDFVNLEDDSYVTANGYIQSEITLKGIRWAFTTTYAQYWQPVTWLSMMLDYQLYGLNAGGYHVTNLILHILSTLLLFRLFHRMTGEIWKSAFVAAIFAIHPLRVESVAWVAKRRDVLCILFSILTLCLYVWYTEKPVLKRYLFVCICFVLTLMSKPMVVTLPLVMILLDYWPLGRFESPGDNLILRQLKEKAPLFVLSGVFSIIAIYAHNDSLMERFSFNDRLVNAVVSFVMYLEKTFWPHDMTVLQLFSAQLPVGQIIYSALLIIFISVFVMITWKKHPYLFVGWLWYTISIFPTLGIVQYGLLALSDHHTYFPSIGIGIMLAWGIPLLFPSKDMRKKVLIPASIAVIIIVAAVAWKQCGYWKNSIELFNHTCRVTNNNYQAHNNRGMAFADRGQYQHATEDFSEAIRINPSSQYYYNRGSAYDRLGQYQRAVADYSAAIRLEQNHFSSNRYASYSYAAYTYRAIAYFNQNNTERGCQDAQKACELGNCHLLENVKGKGYCR